MAQLDVKMDRLHSVKFNVPRSRPDPRDLTFAISQSIWMQQVDLREWASPVESQYTLGSCVANAITNAYELMAKKQTGSDIDLSRLFLYYNTRLLQGTLGADTGSDMRTGLEAAAKFGICDETTWPYSLDKLNAQPPAICYTEAKSRSISNYRKLSGNDEIVDAVNDGKPVVFGMDIFRDFMFLNAFRTVVSIPSPTDVITGSHAMCIVGFDLDHQLFLAKNSFGTEWGDGGYCWIPFCYLAKYGYDMWTFDIPDAANTQSVISGSNISDTARLMLPLETPLFTSYVGMISKHMVPERSFRVKSRVMASWRVSS